MLHICPIRKIVPCNKRKWWNELCSQFQASGFLICRPVQSCYHKIINFFVLWCIYRGKQYGDPNTFLLLSGPNTFLLLSMVINALADHCQKLSQKPSEILCFLNDLPENDIFVSLNYFVTFIFNSGMLMLAYKFCRHW